MIFSHTGGVGEELDTGNNDFKDTSDDFAFLMGRGSHLS